MTEVASKRKEIKAAEPLKNIMRDYYLELDRASKSKKEKVAWCSSVGPAELLRGFGFKVYFPENHSAILGAKRTAVNYMPFAHALGYSPDICSYLTTDIGAFLKKQTPLKDIYGIDSVPKPDVLVYNTNQCREIQEWFSYYARAFKVPILGVNSPKAIENLEEAQIESVESQFLNMLKPLEKIAARKLDEKELKNTLALSLQATKLWKAVLDTAMNVPSPLTFFDSTIHMGPIVVLRGTKIAVDYYKLLLKEMNERVKNKIGAVDNEIFRLYWDGMPIWGKLNALSTLFMNLRTCVVASTYCNSWVFEDFDPKKTFYTMAKAYTELFINRSEIVKEKIIADIVRRFKIHGVIFHDSKTCPNNSNTRFMMPARMQELFNIPSLVIYGDLNDLRCYSEEQTKTSIEAFIEQLSERHTKIRRSKLCNS